MKLRMNSLFGKDRPRRNWKPSVLLGFCQSYEVWYRLVKFSKHRVSSTSRHTVDVCSRWTSIEARQRQASTRTKRKKGLSKLWRGGRTSAMAFEWHGKATRRNFRNCTRHFRVQCVYSQPSCSFLCGSFSSSIISFSLFSSISCSSLPLPSSRDRNSMIYGYSEISP